MKIKKNITPFNVQVVDSFIPVTLLHTYLHVVIEPLPTSIADIYVHDGTVLGAGWRFVELLKIKDNAAVVRYLNNTYSVRLETIKIDRLCSKHRLFVDDEHNIYVVYPDNDYICLGHSKKIQFRKCDDYDKLKAIIAIKPRKVVMNLNSIKSFEDMVAICPVARRVDPSNKVVAGKFYLLAINGTDLLGYDEEGRLIRFKGEQGERVLINNSSKLLVEQKIEGHYSLKNRVTNRSRLLGFSDSELNDGSINLDDIEKSLPKTLEKSADCNIMEKDKMSTEIAQLATEAAPAAPETPAAPKTVKGDGKATKTTKKAAAPAPKAQAAPAAVTAEASSAAPAPAAPAAKSAGKPSKVEPAATGGPVVDNGIVKIPNPPGADGKPRRGRPPVGWRKQKLDEFLAAGSITKQQYDDTLKTIEG